MNRRLGEVLRNDAEGASKDVIFRIPCMIISTLINLIAIGKRVASDGNSMSNRGLRRSSVFMEQLVYEQAYQHAGPDEIWRDPEDGTYHHPTFPEQGGEAWQAVVQYDEERFGMQLIELASGMLARGDAAIGMAISERLEHHEHELLDIYEVSGSAGLVKALLRRGSDYQENS